MTYSIVKEKASARTVYLIFIFNSRVRNNRCELKSENVDDLINFEI